MVSTLEQFMIGIAVIALVYFLTRRRQPQDGEFKKLYHDILTSDKYKVKGKFEE